MKWFFKPAKWVDTKLGEYFLSPREPGKWSKKLGWATAISVLFIGGVAFYFVTDVIPYDLPLVEEDATFLRDLTGKWYIQLILKLCFVGATLNWLLHFRWLPSARERKEIDEMHKKPLQKGEHWVYNRWEEISGQEQYFASTFRQRNHLPQLGRLSIALAFLIFLLLFR